MDIIYNWVKNIVCFCIFLTMIHHLLPKDNYQKYVRFFSGMLLVVLVISPLLSLFGKEGVLLQRINQTSFFQEMDNLKLDTEYLEQEQKEIYIRQYENAIGMDISRMAEERQLSANQVEVRLSEEYQVESIAIQVNAYEEGEVAIESISLLDSGREYPAVSDLKQELMEFYRIGEEQIDIEVRGHYL